jgi:hypothetical protein
MILKLVKLALTWVLSHCNFRMFTANQPVGHRLGGHDVPELPDKFIVFGIWYNDQPLLVGYFQHC